jgi:hypothetical protein
MSLHEVLELSKLWPVLLPVGLLLGVVVAAGRTSLRRLVWFLPILAATAVACTLLFTESGRPLELFIVWLLGLLPAFLSACIVADLCIRRRAARWITWAAVTVSCVAAAPLVGFSLLIAGCVITRDCL